MLRKLGTIMATLLLATGMTLVGCGDDDGGCTDTCDTENDTQCSGTLVQTCEADADGCLAWADTEDCADSGETCDDTTGDCTVSCTDNCTAEDDTQCSGTIIQTCTLFTDGCLDWEDGTDCDDTGEVCDDSGTDAVCAAGCTDNCVAVDDTQCNGTVIETCEVGTNDCFDWVAGTDCADTSEICDDSGATAVCATACTSDCTVLNATQCGNATTLETCTDGGDGCMYWIDSTCTGACAGDPAACFDSGTGDACDDVYNLDGHTFPHTIVGVFDTGALPFQSNCSNSGDHHAMFASYTVSATAPDIQITVQHNGSNLTYVGLAAYTTTSASGVCNAAQRTELGCIATNASSAVMSLNANDLGLNPGDVVYFMIHGDGTSYWVEDPDVTIVLGECGNGIIELSEECDDQNTTAGDGCAADCTVELAYSCTGEPSTCVTTCGNGTVEIATGERCDDGNTTAGDGCDASCQWEYLVETEPNDNSTDALANNHFTDGGMIAGSWSVAGDQDIYAIDVPAGGYLWVETLDDSGYASCVSTDTQVTIFDTDGTTQLAYDDDDGLSTCSYANPFDDTALANMAGGTYYILVNDYSNDDTGNYTLLITVIVPVCGDGVIDGFAGEVCDDNNTNAGDGCATDCTVEATYWCTGEPSICMVPACGDGYVNDAAEECDDGNANAGDGCTAACVSEPFVCNTGETHVTIVSTDVPVSIPDPGTATSTVTVTNTGTVMRAMVTIGDITHTWDSDLDIYLISPATTPVELTTDNGSSDDNYTNTVFDDGCQSASGNGPITGGTAPFTGCYAPEGNLLDFVGEAAAGTWTLEVTDDGSIATGTLNAWTLDLCVL